MLKSASKDEAHTEENQLTIFSRLGGYNSVRVSLFHGISMYRALFSCNCIFQMWIFLCSRGLVHK